MWGCTAAKVLSIMKLLLIIVAICAIGEIIISSIGVSYGGSDWKGVQPAASVVLFSFNIAWSCIILILTIVILMLLFKDKIELSVLLELDLCVVIVLMIFSISGGIFISSLN
jgi:hypothetical protein